MLYLHQQGIVHRDLALRNLLVAPSDKPGIKYIIKIAGWLVCWIGLLFTYGTTSKVCGIIPDDSIKQISEWLDQSLRDTTRRTARRCQFDGVHLKCSNTGNSQVNRMFGRSEW